MRDVKLLAAKALVTSARLVRKLAPAGPARVTESAVGHVLLRIVDTERDDLNRWLYDARRSYLPGSSFFAAGLAPWEQEALFAPPFPTSGRWLVAAAGGGREVAALRSRGLDVWCFEPSTTLFAGLTTVAAHGRAHCGRFADLDDARGPLAPLVAAAPFDAVLIGSSALSHVTLPPAQHALFAALARLAPRAPIVSSQFMTAGDRDRRAGARFTLDHGFHYVFDEAELTALATTHGYRIARRDGWLPESTIWISSRTDL